MEKLIVACSFFAILGFGSNALAIQEVEAIVVDYRMDHGNNICTITIDRNHPRTTQTAQCHNKVFSWGCLSGDYRFELARSSEKNNSPMKIRYSEYSCENRTRDMILLTVW